MLTISSYWINKSDLPSGEVWQLLNPANNRPEQSPGVLGKQKWEERRSLAPLVLAPGEPALGLQLKTQPEIGAPASGSIGQVIPGERRRESRQIRGVKRSSHCLGSRGHPSGTLQRALEKSPQSFPLELGEYSPTYSPPSIGEGSTVGVSTQLGCPLLRTPKCVQASGRRNGGAWAERQAALRV